MCRAAQETRGVRQTSVYFTGVKKTPYSRIYSSALPEQKHMKFSVWIPSGCGTSSSKFELNLPSISRDMRLQSSSYFTRSGSHLKIMSSENSIRGSSPLLLQPCCKTVESSSCNKHIWTKEHQSSNRGQRNKLCPVQWQWNGRHYRCSITPLYINSNLLN